MILAIFVLASLLLVSAALALVAAINLVPTDFGFTYAQIAAVLLGAGIITLAIGLAARALHRQMHRMTLALENNLRMGLTAPEVPSEAAPVSVHEASLPHEAEGRGLGAVVAVGAAGVAAGALVAGAHGLQEHGLQEHGLAEHADAPPAAPEMTHDPVPPVVPDRMMEELESDLFALTPTPVAEAQAAETQGAETQISETPAPEPAPSTVAPEPEAAEQDAPAAAEAPLAAVEKALAAVETSQFGQDFGLSPDFTLPLTLPPDPIPAPEPVPPNEPEANTTPEPQPAEPAVEVAPAPQLGLIADADLAALAEDMLPPLAPISTLEVVGAYDSAGTRFTMYSDGSVTAAGPEGETRFRTLDDLRRHLGTHQG